MRREYQKPELRCQIVQLGVFGNYGTPDPDGGGRRLPSLITGEFQIRMD